MCSRGGEPTDGPVREPAPRYDADRWRLSGPVWVRSCCWRSIERVPNRSGCNSSASCARRSVQAGWPPGSDSRPLGRSPPSSGSRAGSCSSPIASSRPRDSSPRGQVRPPGWRRARSRPSAAPPAACPGADGAGSLAPPRGRLRSRRSRSHELPARRLGPGDARQLPQRHPERARVRRSARHRRPARGACRIPAPGSGHGRRRRADRDLPRLRPGGQPRAPSLAGDGIRQVAIEDPGDEDYHEISARLGIEAVPVPIDERGIDVEALAATDSAR